MQCSYCTKRIVFPNTRVNGIVCSRTLRASLHLQHPWIAASVEAIQERCGEEGSAVIGDLVSEHLPVVTTFREVSVHIPIDDTKHPAMGRPDRVMLLREHLWSAWCFCCGQSPCWLSMERSPARCSQKVLASGRYDELFAHILVSAPDVEARCSPRQ